ncbi:MAG: ribbon-helix-helix protein, CopG family [Candidatus Levybacteria bacterium]|nr:ribbon-helix-helix protein, CopG family [Candidatus Levybacteria bacterium]
MNKQSLQTESLHARIPQERLEDIDRIAESIGRSRNWVFNEALNQYLDVQKWQLDLIKERLSEAESSTAKFTSNTDVMKRQDKRLKEKLGI